MSIIADIYVMLRDDLRVAAKHCSIFIVAAHVIWILVALSSPAAATSIVSVLDYRDHTVVIAADALVRRVYRSTGKAEFVKTCKILTKPSCVVALAGHSTEAAISFNLWNLATSACEDSGALYQKADRFVQIAQPEIERLVRYLGTAAPNEFAKIVAGVPVVAAIFVGIEKNQLRMLTRGFKITNDQIVPLVYNNDPSAKDLSYVAGGNTAAILAYLNGHSEWKQTLDIAQFVLMLVNLEIKDAPAEVGPPVSVLEISQSIMRPDAPILRWIQRGACQ